MIKDMAPASPTTREVYPSAPLRFVALEVQFSYAPPLGTEQGRAEVYNHLAERFPVAEPETTVAVTVVPGGTGAPETTLALRMVDAGRTRSVTVGPSSLTVQTSAFVDADDFLTSVREGLEAVAFARPGPMRRIGLRYIDEIRVPGVARARDWDGWVDSRLLGATLFAGDHQVDTADGVLIMTLAAEHYLAIRFGPRVGFAVDPNGALRLPDAERGPFFLLDFDSFWMPDAGRHVSFDVETALATARALDDPAHRFFESAITDRLRDEVLRRAAS
jgi:uncharacterized protein (TIGR04255 family)